MYASSLAEFGELALLPGCGGSVLLRDVPGSDARDAIGPYPLFCCEQWAALTADLDLLGSRAISLSLVADPFGRWDLPTLQRTFDRILAFKEHAVVDCDRGAQLSRHHQYYVRKAEKQVAVDLVPEPATFLDVWEELYRHLVSRHAITGIRAFSRKAFALQLATPGVVVFRAQHKGQTVAAHLWYEADGVAYSHLAACNPLGYATLAMYGLYGAALDYFARRVRWINLGGAGGTASTHDGLARFKRGWTKDVRPVYFCGRIIDRQRYDALVVAAGGGSGDLFPAYRRSGVL